MAVLPDEVTLEVLVDLIRNNQLNYTVQIPYNDSIATGGDSLNNNLNLYYTVRVACGKRKAERRRVNVG